MFEDALVADEAEDFSMKVIEAEDDESLTEKPEVKLVLRAANRCT